MFKMGVAHSLTADTQAAARSLTDQALRALDGLPPTAALLFSTFGRNHADLLLQLTQLLPACPIVGGSSNGEVSRQLGYRVGSSLLIVFASDSIQIEAGVLRDLSFGDDAASLAAARQQLCAPDSGTSLANHPAHSTAGIAPVLGLLFPDGIGLDGAAVVQLFARFFPTTRFFGGSAAENFLLNPTDQFFNTEVLHNAVPYLLFYGPLRYHWGVTEGLNSGWRAVGQRLDAHCDGKWIQTIDQKRALDYMESRYRMEGGILSVVHPFVIYPNPNSDEHYFRDVIRYSEQTGALESLQTLPTDCQVQLTQPDPQAILAVSRKSVLQSLAHYPGPHSPAGVLWFACVSRALVLQEDPAREFCTATELIPNTLPIAGFYAYGEIAPAGQAASPTFHSSTLVTLLLGEEPRTATGLFNAQDRFSADNLALDNQRLTEALATARAELAAARQELQQYKTQERVAAHSKTLQNTHYRALALELVCAVLDTRFGDFKRVALKGNSPRLNKSALARLVNEQHQLQFGSPFPLTPAHLSRLLATGVASDGAA